MVRRRKRKAKGSFLEALRGFTDRLRVGRDQQLLGGLVRKPIDKIVHSASLHLDCHRFGGNDWVGPSPRVSNCDMLQDQRSGLDSKLLPYEKLNSVTLCG